MLRCHVGISLEHIYRINIFNKHSRYYSQLQAKYSIVIVSYSIFDNSLYLIINQLRRLYIFIVDNCAS